MGFIRAKIFGGNDVCVGQGAVLRQVLEQTGVAVAEGGGLEFLVQLSQPG